MSIDTSSVLERLKIVFDIQTDRALCEELKVPKTTLSTWRQRDSVPYSLCVQIAIEKNVSLDWLLAGQGEMMKSKLSNAERKAAKIAELMEGLSAEQQQEILSVISEKKRFNDLEEYVKGLKTA